jgi:hypothetical protein
MRSRGNGWTTPPVRKPDRLLKNGVAHHGGWTYRDVSFSERVDARAERHATYAVSPRHRKRIEDEHGGAKTIGEWRNLRHRSLAAVDWSVTVTLNCYHLARVHRLLAPTSG